MIWEEIAKYDYGVVVYVSWFFNNDSNKCRCCEKDVQFKVERVIVLEKSNEIDKMLLKCPNCRVPVLCDKTMSFFSFPNDLSVNFFNEYCLFFKKEFEELLGCYDFSALNVAQKKLLKINGYFS